MKERIHTKNSIKHPIINEIINLIWILHVWFKDIAHFYMVWKFQPAICILYSKNGFSFIWCRFIKYLRCGQVSFCGNVLQTLLNHKMTEMGVQNSKNKIGSNFLIIKH